ncbi:MAG: hypothetical protein AMXMBFR33_63300 [Candidatus Xenobia bacterium]
MDPLTGLTPLQSLNPTAFGLSSLAPLGSASSRCAGCGPTLGGQDYLMAMQQLNMSLLGLLTVLMGGPAMGSPGAAAASPGGSGAQSGPVNSAAPTGDSPPTSTGGSTSIGSGTKVLMIGDSHTVGTFGTELDRQLRSTGAQVETYGASGSSATQWANGGTTSSGFVARHANGSVEQPQWNSRQSIPRLEDLIARNKPDVIIVNLGANFRSGDPSAQVKSLGEIAKRHNIKLIWVGPPKTRQDSSNSAGIEAFDQKMAAAMAPYGTYIASDPFTPSYSGGDGVHYSGAQGNETARSWARGVFGQITGR